MTQPNLRFALPPSLGTPDVGARLGAYLATRVGGTVDVRLAESYQTLGNDLLAGKVDAAWAPPFICARVEAMGARILCRGVRRGTSTYRSALLCRAGVKLGLDKLQGLTAAWVDRDSVAGYLLPMAWLKAKNVNVKTAFPFQQFVGSYAKAIEYLLTGTVDVTAIFAPPAGANAKTTGVDEIAPEAASKVEVWAYTDESPNDAVAVSMNTPAELTASLEKALLGMHETPAGRDLLTATFHADKFEPSPRMAYRALYRVALAGI